MSKELNQNVESVKSFKKVIIQEIKKSNHNDEFKNHIGEYGFLIGVIGKKSIMKVKKGFLIIDSNCLTVINNDCNLYRIKSLQAKSLKSQLSQFTDKIETSFKGLEVYKQFLQDNKSIIADTMLNISIAKKVLKDIDLKQF